MYGKILSLEFHKDLGPRPFNKFLRDCILLKDLIRSDCFEIWKPDIGNFNEQFPYFFLIISSNFMKSSFVN